MKTSSGPSTAPREWTVWACAEGCDYWRQEESTGIHAAENPENWRAHSVTHKLEPVVVVERASLDRVVEERDRLREALEKFAGWVERDRREPDKMLCVAQSMRRAALQSGEGERHED